MSMNVIATAWLTARPSSAVTRRCAVTLLTSLQRVIADFGDQLAEIDAQRRALDARETS